MTNSGAALFYSSSSYTTTKSNVSTLSGAPTIYIKDATPETITLTADTAGKMSRAAGWQTTTSFGTKRYNHTSVAYNGYVYVFDGRMMEVFRLTDVQYAAFRRMGV